MSRLEDKDEMHRIYEQCVLVYSHESTGKDACAMLRGKTNASEASLKMYFDIYSHMRQGTCYKMGTSAAFTRYLIEHIYEDNGNDALIRALASAKQNSEYRISCGNPQPGIEVTCREIIKDYNLPISYEELDDYYGSDRSKNRKKRIPSKKVVNKTKNNDIVNVSIKYGDISFEARGRIEDVLEQLQSFSDEILPKVCSSLSHSKQLEKTPSSQKKKKPSSIKKEKAKAKASVSVGERIKKAYPDIDKLSSKMDFKARMIPLLFLADKHSFQKEFSIRDIIQIMMDVLSENASKKQVEDVFLRRADWFEKVNQNPRKYKLLATAKDYARNILAE